MQGAWGPLTLNPRRGNHVNWKQPVRQKPVPLAMVGEKMYAPEYNFTGKHRRQKGNLTWRTVWKCIWEQNWPSDQAKGGHPRKCVTKEIMHIGARLRGSISLETDRVETWQGALNPKA